MKAAFESQKANFNGIRNWFLWNIKIKKMSNIYYGGRKQKSF